MKHSILRTISLCSRNLKPLLHTEKSPIYFQSQRYWRSSISTNNRFFTSVIHNPNCSIPQSKWEHLGSVAVLNSEDSQDLSNEALKKKIDRLAEGDGEAIPEIFEAIMKRKLIGKSGEADEELMKDVRSNPKFDREFNERDFDFNDEEYGDGDEEGSFDSSDDYDDSDEDDKPE